MQRNEGPNGAHFLPPKDDDNSAGAGCQSEENAAGVYLEVKMYESVEPYVGVFMPYQVVAVPAADLERHFNLGSHPSLWRLRQETVGAGLMRETDDIFSVQDGGAYEGMFVLPRRNATYELLVPGKATTPLESRAVQPRPLGNGVTFSAPSDTDDDTDNEAAFCSPVAAPTGIESAAANSPRVHVVDAPAQLQQSRLGHTTNNQGIYSCPVCGRQHGEDDLEAFQIHLLTEHPGVEFNLVNFEIWPQTQETVAAPQQAAPVIKTFSCQICLEDIPEDMKFSQAVCSAAHDLCNACVQQYIAGKIQDRTFPIKCPTCEHLYTQTEIQKVVDGGTFDKYLDLSLRAVTSSSTLYVCCPKPDCCGTIERSNPDERELAICPVETCNTEFCTLCKRYPYHYLISCAQYEKVIKEQVEREASRSQHRALLESKLREEEQAKRLVEIVSIPCQKCFVPILNQEEWKKKGEDPGCAHMTCPHCRQEYCAKCLDQFVHTKERGLSHLNIHCRPELREEKVRQLWQAKNAADLQMQRQEAHQHTFEEGFDHCSCCEMRVADILGQPGGKIFVCVNCPGEELVCSSCELKSAHSANGVPHYLMLLKTSQVSFVLAQSVPLQTPQVLPPHQEQPQATYVHPIVEPQYTRPGPRSFFPATYIQPPVSTTELPYTGLTAAYPDPPQISLSQPPSIFHIQQPTVTPVYYPPYWNSTAPGGEELDPTLSPNTSTGSHSNNPLRNNRYTPNRRKSSRGRRGNSKQY